MSAEPPETPEPEPPALPKILLEPWPVIIVIAAGWLIAVILAFTVAGLHDWRPIAVAGLGVGVLGTSRSEAWRVLRPSPPRGRSVVE